MNARILFHLTAASLLMLATLAALVGGNSSLPAAQASTRIVDLPAITVRPAAGDAAYYQAHRIVDLPRITVHPEAGDVAAYVLASVRAADCLC